MSEFSCTIKDCGRRACDPEKCKLHKSDSMSEAKDNIQPDKIDNITKAKNRISELEAEKAELIKFVELMYLYGGLSPELLSTKSDVIFYEADRLLKKHGVEI